MAKDLFFGKDARLKISKGIDAVADAVKVTMGAKGRNVFLQHEQLSGPPSATKDGVSVAERIFLDDPIEDMGAQTVKEVAKKTAQDSGDGTTTATVLTQAMVSKGLDYIQKSRGLFPVFVNPMDVKRGMDMACTDVVNYLQKVSKPVSGDVELMKKVATVSANGDKHIGELIGNTFEEVTENGQVSVRESKGEKTYVEISKGMNIEAGLDSESFITDQRKMKAKLENPFVLIVEEKISHFSQIESFVRVAAGSNRPIFIVSSDIAPEVLGVIISNVERGALKAATMMPPQVGGRQQNVVDDIAMVTGATVISERTGNKLIKTMKKPELAIKMMGSAETIESTKSDTFIVNGGGDKAKIEDLCRDLSEAASKTENSSEEWWLKERVKYLKGGAATIYVGANSKVEKNEIKDRVDDAIHATMSAIKEGVLSGGGAALLNASEDLSGSDRFMSKDVAAGYRIVLSAIREPFNQILRNSGASSRRIKSIAKEVLKGGYGKMFDLKVDDVLTSASSGVYDPTKVTRVALQNSCSVAGIVLTTECTISENLKG